MAFDKINKFEEQKQNKYSKKSRSVPYEKYFGEMDLTDEEKEERKELAKKIELVMLFLFAFIESSINIGQIDRETTLDLLRDRYYNIFIGDKKFNEYISQYVSMTSEEILDTTILNLDKDYFLSEDRAMFIAENESNSIRNYMQYIEAVQNGCTKKQWITMGDSHVRLTHGNVDGEIIPINELFKVGDSLLLFPKDESHNPSPNEVVNCRCTVKYLK